MRHLVASALVGAALAGTTLAGACGRDAPPAPAESPPMPAAEMERGELLCGKYVERLCECARAHPELQSDCELARARPEALGLHLALLRGKKGPLNTRERLETEAGAREIIAACVRADGRLDPARCPRIPAAPPGRIDGVDAKSD